MLTGDAETINEEQMIHAPYNLKSEILKAGHHGSYSSNSSEWIHVVKPETVIIQVGADNEYNLPNNAVIKRFQQAGADIYRTDTDGTIIITTDGEKYYIETLKTNTDAA